MTSHASGDTQSPVPALGPGSAPRDGSAATTAPRDTCVGYDARSRHACTREAVDTVIAACIHEHIAPRLLYQFHVADLAQELMLCGDCQDCADPHRCVLVAVPTRKAIHA